MVLLVEMVLLAVRGAEALLILLALELVEAEQLDKVITAQTLRHQVVVVVVALVQ